MRLVSAALCVLWLPLVLSQDWQTWNVESPPQWLQPPWAKTAGLENVALPVAPKPIPPPPAPVQGFQGSGRFYPPPPGTAAKFSREWAFNEGAKVAGAPTGQPDQAAAAPAAGAPPPARFQQTPVQAQTATTTPTFEPPQQQQQAWQPRGYKDNGDDSYDRVVIRSRFPHKPGGNQHGGPHKHHKQNEQQQHPPPPSAEEEEFTEDAAMNTQEDYRESEPVRQPYEEEGREKYEQMEDREREARDREYSTTDGEQQQQSVDRQREDREMQVEIETQRERERERERERVYEDERETERFPPSPTDAELASTEMQPQDTIATDYRPRSSPTTTEDSRRGEDEEEAEVLEENREAMEEERRLPARRFSSEEERDEQDEDEATEFESKVIQDGRRGSVDTQRDSYAARPLSSQDRETERRANDVSPSSPSSSARVLAESDMDGRNKNEAVVSDFESAPVMDSTTVLETSSSRLFAGR